MVRKIYAMRWLVEHQMLDVAFLFLYFFWVDYVIFGGVKKGGHPMAEECAEEEVKEYLGQYCGSPRLCASGLVIQKIFFFNKFL